MPPIPINVAWSMPIAILSCVLLPMGSSIAADTMGGSVGLTSDYLVRGITRSADRAALQADVHYANDSGLFVGMFASSVRTGAGERDEAELSAFSGWSWSLNDAWRSKVSASYYSYPWSSSGSKYTYVELGAEASYGDWLDLALGYSPDAPRYVTRRGLMGVAALSGEIDLQAPLVSHLAAAAGVGYSHLGGPGHAGYGYWSLGFAYVLAPVSVSLSYVDTTAGAVQLYYEAAAHGRWTGTVIWRF